MSQVKVSANVSGSGIFTIASPNSNTDRTLTLPDATDTLVGKATSDTLTNKTLTSAILTTPTITNNLTFGTALAETPSGSAPLAFCRAWVNFDGNDTPTIRASYNVSSITDNGVCDYTVNFTTSMTDANYCITGVAGLNTTSLRIVVQPWTLANPTTSAVRIQTPSSDGFLVSDPKIISIAVFR